MQTALIAAEIGGSLTIWGMFAQATITVKLVMISLVLASFWTWSIIVQKTIQYRAVRREVAAFDQAFWSGEPLDTLYEQLGPEPEGASQKVFVAGMTEWRRSHRDDGGLIPGATARIDRAMNVAIAKEAVHLQKGLQILATTGSTAPFIGLFGTVFGIMNAFIEIAEQQNTSLAVVAPGIAEALLATGLGLIAAIPAVIYYNKFSSESDAILGDYDAFADEFATILSRQLDS
jgi:biopolymer transport protein TolQ